MSNSDNRRATVRVRLKEGVLDPQGQTIHKALVQMGYHDILSVRSGRFFELEIRGDATEIDRQLNEICTKLLANPVIEEFLIETVK